MRGLTAMIARRDAEGLRAALTMAAAIAALGGRARVFVDEGAVALLAPPLRAPEDAARENAGLPPLVATMATARDLGVEMIACQTGLALAGLDAAMLPEGWSTGGMMGLLASLGEDRLVAL